MINEFQFDKTTQRYRVISGAGKGQFISKTAINNLIDNYQKQQLSRLNAISSSLFNGDITMMQWEQETKTIIKTTAINLYKLSKPDLNNQDLGIIGNKLKQQYRHLRKLSIEINRGQLTQGQIKNRNNLIFNETSTLISETGKFRSHDSSGFIWEKRMLRVAEHCDSCLTYASVGWQRIGSLPNPTENCECRANCKCYKIYSSAILRPI